MQFIPIVFLLLLYLFPLNFMKITQNALGKFLLLCIVVFYTVSTNKLIGVFVALLFILYYQSDLVEGFEELNGADIGGSTTVDFSNTSATASTKFDTSGSYPVSAAPRPPRRRVEGFLATNETNYTTLYKKQPTRSEAADNFAKQYCVNGKVVSNNNLDVKNEMVPQVFPEISFDEGVCNPCDRTCRFSIIETKLDTEETMIVPKSSNSWYDAIIQSIVPVSTPAPRGAGAPVSEMFSLWSGGVAAA
jgi:hypothetical protein